MTDYRERIGTLASEVERVLPVNFSDPHVRGRRPGDANSEFLNNKAMGDWAEELVRDELKRVLTNHRAVKYGNADDIVAGDAGFAEHYTAYQDELSESGKRPDILIIPSELTDSSWHNDISGARLSTLGQITPRAVAGVEVRSSRFYALEYARVRGAEGRRGARVSQSFTPKLEDLRLVKRWVDTYGVPHYYFQVFFDIVYGISFEEVLLILARHPSAYEIERNRRNQDKPTIHIPVTRGIELARFTDEPYLEPIRRTTRLGRVDMYLRPAGGRAPIDPSQLARLIPSLMSKGC